jgi:hypothetical protein
VGRGCRERSTVIAAGVAAISCAVALGAGSAVAQGPGPPARCARRGPLHIAADAWWRARAAMAPSGATAMRLCRYAGLNARPTLKLKRAMLVTDPGTIARLVADLDALRPIRGALSCPTSDGSQVLALLAYPNGHRVTISIATGGCGIVTNGNLVRTIANRRHTNPVGPRLSRQPKRLVGANVRLPRR